MFQHSPYTNIVCQIAGSSPFFHVLVCDLWGMRKASSGGWCKMSQIQQFSSKGWQDLCRPRPKAKEDLQHVYIVQKVSIKESLPLTWINVAFLGLAVALRSFERIWNAHINLTLFLRTTLEPPPHIFIQGLFLCWELVSILYLALKLTYSLHNGTKGNC